MSRRALSLAVLAGLLAGPAFGQAVQGQILNEITNAYANVTVGWLETLMPMARNLFVALATVEIAWSGVRWSLAREGGDALLANMLLKVLVMMILFTLVVSASSWVPFIVSGFIEAGSEVAGFDSLDPSKVLGQGIHVANRLYDNARQAFTWWRMPLWAYLAPVVVVASFAVIAGVMVMTLVESFFVIGGGVLLLGFAGSRVTASFAEGYLLSAIRVGIKLFVLYLLIAVGSQLPAEWLDILDEVHPADPSFFFEVMGGALILAMLTLRVPRLAAEMVWYRAQLGLERALAD